MNPFIIVLIALMVFASIVAAAEGAIMFFRFLRRKKNPVELSSVVKLTMELMTRSDGWRIDAYKAKHETGAELWIANADYGFSLTINDILIRTTPEEDTAMWNQYQEYLGTPHLAKINRDKEAKQNEAIIRYAVEAKQFAERIER